MKYGMALSALLVIGLAGCAGKWDKKYEEDEAARQAAEAAEQDRAREAQTTDQLAINPLDDPASPLSKRVIYFDYDSSQINGEDRDVVIAHGRHLAQNPQLSVVVEGHTDERGSREYNMALGERRSNTVVQLLLLQGVTREQMQPISFGEERPVALGGDEESWRVNRRVELLYSGQ